MWIVAPVSGGRRPGPGTGAGEVVGVVVGLEDVLDGDPHVAREGEVALDVELGVDDGGDARVLVADQIGRAAQVVVGDLPEEHVGDHHRPWTCAPPSPTTRLPSPRSTP